MKKPSFYSLFFAMILFSSTYPDCHASDNLHSEQTNLVFGYMRNNEKLYKLFIPVGVKLICLLLYYGKDYFDDGCVGTLIRTHNDQQIITMKQNQDKKINTAYGSLFINPLSPNSDKIHIWKFKIISCHGYIYIGIDEAKAMWRNSWFAGRKETNNYSYCCNGRKYSHRTGGMGQYYSITGFYVGSVVLMELDLTSKSGTLSFGPMKYGNDWQNDAFFSVTPAFKHIKKNKKLRLAVSLRSGSTIQLLEYKEESLK